MLDPSSIEIPEEIDSARLRIRCPRPGDGERVHAGVVETLAMLRAWPASLPWALAEPSVEASEAFCREGQANWRARRDFPMLAFLKPGGEHVGNVGLHRPAWSAGSIEVGFWCRPSHQGRGYVTEAVRAACGFAFEVLGMREVTCLSDEANAASRAVAERAGFVLRDLLRKERVGSDGTPRTTCLYVLDRR